QNRLQKVDAKINVVHVVCHQLASSTMTSTSMSASVAISHGETLKTSVLHALDEPMRISTLRTLAIGICWFTAPAISHGDTSTPTTNDTSPSTSWRLYASTA